MDKRYLTAAQVAGLADLLEDSPRRVGVIDQVLRAAADGQGNEPAAATATATIRRQSRSNLRSLSKVHLVCLSYGITVPMFRTVTELVRGAVRAPAAQYVLGSIETLGELAVRVEPVDSSVPVPVVDTWFRRDRQLRALVVRHGEQYLLLSRERLQFELAGPFGFGRSLHARDTIAALVPDSCLMLPAQTGLQAAGHAVLNRDDAERFDDVLVGFDDAGVGVASVTAIFAGLAATFRTFALTDALTGLPNRRVLEQATGQITRPGGRAREHALLYIDLDRFKDINDTLGHRVGDSVLVEFANRLRQCVRQDDLVVRVGGDEFAVLLPHVRPEQAEALAERIVLSAASPFVINDHVINLSASVGLALGGDTTAEHTADAVDVLIRHADAAMYQAKRTRGAVRRVRPSEDAARHHARRSAISRRIETALAEQRFEVHYQPIIDLASGSVLEMEALLRWTDNELGAVTPDEFVSVAEATGRIIPLGRWVLMQACTQAKSWADQGRAWTVAVNLSPLQLLDGTLVENVKSVLGTTGLAPESLRFEITETQAIADMKATTNRLADLRQLGVRLSIDDFGTGYSSLSMLRQLPVDTVKIDRSFINRIDGTDKADAALVRLVIETARAFGLSVVAEGVERETQHHRLADMGCPAAQGFLFGRPAHPSHYEAS